MRIPRYTIRYAGHDFLADSKQGMIDNIVKYLTNKNKAINLEMITLHVNNNIKESSISNAKDIGSKLNTPHKSPLTFKEAFAGALAVLKVVGGIAVPNEEVRRRQNICIGCPLKTQVSNCYGCGFSGWLTKWLTEFRNKFTGAFSLSTEVTGHYCGVCQCALTAMLPSKMSSFQESEAKQNERPDHCWVKKTSPNYVES